jgi:hypothetical protein
MLRRLRHVSHQLSAVWLLALLLTAVWQPALMAASEVHEVSHLAIAGHAHEDAHDEPGIPSDEQPQGDLGGFHGLMHLGHCCGQPPAALFEMQPLRLAVRLPLALPEPARPSSRAPLAEVLRPPIVA